MGSNLVGPATVRKGGFLGSHVMRRVALILTLILITIITTNIEHCVPSAQYVPDTVARAQQTLSHWIDAVLLYGWGACSCPSFCQWEAGRDQFHSLPKVTQLSLRSWDSNHVIKPRSHLAERAASRCWRSLCLLTWLDGQLPQEVSHGEMVTGESFSFRFILRKELFWE